MKKPSFPSNESERQKEVEKYQILDTLPEEVFDTITSILANICEVPIAFVAILDKNRNFLKSHYGIDLSEDPRERSFCGHTILEEENFMVVPDASKDERFNDNPLVTEMGVRFYAGASLISPKGFKLGTLCVFDYQPKKLNSFQLNALLGLSKQVIQILENQYKSIKIQETQEELEKRNLALDQLNQTLEEKVLERTAELQKSVKEKEVLLQEVHHRVKNNLQVLSSILSLYGGQTQNEAVQNFINEYKNNLHSIALVHENLYQERDFTEINFFKYVVQLAAYISQSSNSQVHVKVDTKTEEAHISTDKAIISGLVINKLLTQVNKQARANQVNKKLNIQLEKKGNEISISITDTDVNQSLDQKEQLNASFQFEIISILVEQLNGSFETNFSQGVKHTLSFEL